MASLPIVHDAHGASAAGSASWLGRVAQQLHAGGGGPPDDASIVRLVAELVDEMSAGGNTSTASFSSSSSRPVGPLGVLPLVCSILEVSLLHTDSKPTTATAAETTSTSTADSALQAATNLPTTLLPLMAALARAFARAPSAGTAAGGPTAAPSHSRQGSSSHLSPPFTVPNSSLAALFPVLCQSFELFYRESARTIAYVPLLSACLKTLSCLIDDVVRVVYADDAHDTDDGAELLTSAQRSALLNALVAFIGGLHKCIAWGTPFVLQPGHIAPHAREPTPRSRPHAAAHTHVRSGSNTPRSVIAPPSLSTTTATPADGFLSGAGSLFSPTASFALLNSDHWNTALSRVSIHDHPATATDAPPSERTDLNAIAPSDTYQSRVRGPKPTRPSAVNLALSRHSTPPPTEGAPYKLSYAAASEKVRSYCLQCVHAIARSAPKLFHASWLPFLPTDSQSALSARPFAGPSLLTVMLHDPSSKVRALAAQCLATMLVDSPLTRWTGAINEIGAAGGAAAATRIRKNREGKDKKSGAFTSLSVRFADTLRALHAGLLEGLRKESHPSVMTQLLKTVSVLVVHTPYQTMHQTATAAAASGTSATNPNDGLLAPIVDHLLTHMLHEPSSYHTVHSDPPVVTPTPPSRTIRSSVAIGGSSSGLHAPAQASSIKSADLRHAIFSCLASIFDTTSVIAELRACLSPPDARAATYRVEVIPLLVSHARARKPTDPTPDAFTLLAKIARHHPSALARYWRWATTMGTNSVSQLIRECLGCAELAPHTPPIAQDPQTKLLALKILEEWNKQDVGGVGAASASAEDDDDASSGNFEPVSSSPEGFFSLEGARHMVALELIDVYTSHSTDTRARFGATPAEVHAAKQQAVSNGNVRARILACFSLLPFDQWQALHAGHQQALLRLSLDAAKDEVAAVRTAACRCLCLFTLYSARAESSTQAATEGAASSDHPLAPAAYIHASVSSLLDLLDPSVSPVLAVRIRAAWSLANIADFGDVAADSPDRPTSTPTPTPRTLIRTDLQQRLIRTVLASTADNEKVTSNSVRAVGNIARWFPPLDPPSTPVYLRMIDTLLTRIQSSRSHKSKWNACHALGNAFRNADLPALLRRDAAAQSTVERALTLLVGVVRDDRDGSQSSGASSKPSSASKPANFKVRINAAAALSSPPSRAHFGTAFPFALEALLHLCEARLAAGETSTSAPAAAAAASVAVTLADLKYATQLREELLTGLCRLLAQFDGTSQQPQSDEDKSTDAKLCDIYLRHSEPLARIILGERLRWEKECKLLARAARAASGVGSTSRPVAVPTSGLSKSSVSRAQQLVEQAATAVERVLLVLESRGHQPGIAAHFAARANGEVEATSFSSQTSPKTMQ